MLGSLPTVSLLGEPSAAATANARSPDPAAIRQAAKQLEGVFVSLLLKSMRENATEEGLFGGGDQSDVYGGLFDQFMGTHLAEAGSLGIDKMVETYLERTAEQSAPTDSEGIQT